MLSKLRNFSKSKFAPVLVAMIAIPFVFWGMGGVFSGGNTNSIAKINNHNISTEVFMNYINSLDLDKEYIKDNVENGSIEEVLSKLISIKILDLEIIDLGISISEKSLAKKITENKSFHDENKNFSRIKYEKFLITNNISAVEYEERLKNNEKQNKLFSYISGGIKTPYFLINQTYINEAKKINVKYINLDHVYKKEFTDKEINLFISENSESLKRELIDFSYIKLDPKILTQSDDFNKEFYEKIDEIENSIINGSNLDKIKKDYTLKLKNIENYYLKKGEKNNIFIEIYSKKNDEPINIIDKDNFFLLYEIKNNKKILPKTSDIDFLKNVKNKMINNEKKKLHENLLSKIQNKKINDGIFSNITKDNNLIKETEIKSINDDILFENNSLKLIYSLPENSFILISDKNKNIYLAKISEFKSKDLEINSEIMNYYKLLSNNNISKNLYRSFDLYLNTKYKVEINENTLDRIKNYFR